MQKKVFLLLFFIPTIFLSCNKEDDTEIFPAPTINIMPDTQVYQPGETATLLIDIDAPGSISSIVIGSETSNTHNQKANVTGWTYEYLIPDNTAEGDHIVTVTVTDSQDPPKSTGAQATLKIGTSSLDCTGFDESAVNTGEGKIPVTDFTSNTSGLLSAIIINNTNDTGGAGEENPVGCGMVMMFNKTRGEWGGWNGFKLILEKAFSAEEFLTFGRTGATKSLKVDVYRGTKSGSGAFPAAGVPIYVNLGNNEIYGEHPVGRSQFLIGTLTKNNEWETVTFFFDAGNSGNIDNDVADNQTDMMEFLPSGNMPDDGGLYYFDNLRFENDPDAGDGPGPATAVTVCDYDFDDATLINAGWTKIFDDDFTGDLSKWNIWNGGAYNNELQLYQAANLEIVDGVLVITSKRENASGPTNPGSGSTKSFYFTSGRIESKTQISASAATPKVRMLARLKWPSGVGMWPAFWSYGNAWPTNGEIDVLEARGHEPTKYHTNYFYGTQGGNNLVSNATGTINADADLTECYHVYELVWEENTLTSYLDGQLVEVKTSGGYIDDMFGKSQNVVLNLAVGGDFFNNLNPDLIELGTMYVDYVRVYTSN